MTSVRRGLLHDITSPELGMVIDENSLIPTLPGWYLVKVRRTRLEGKTGGFQWRVEAYYGEFVPGMPIKEPALGGKTGSVEDTSDVSLSLSSVRPRRESELGSSCCRDHVVRRKPLHVTGQRQHNWCGDGANTEGTREDEEKGGTFSTGAAVLCGFSRGITSQYLFELMDGIISSCFILE